MNYRHSSKDMLPSILPISSSPFQSEHGWLGVKINYLSIYPVGAEMHFMFPLGQNWPWWTHIQSRDVLCVPKETRRPRWFSSVQDGIYALEKAHMRALHPVSQESPPNVAVETAPMLALVDDNPFHTSPSRKIVEHFLFFVRLSPPGDRWCGVLGFVCVPAGSVSSSSTLQIFRGEASRL